MDDEAQIEAVESLLNTVPEDVILKALQADLERLRILKQKLDLV